MLKSVMWEVWILTNLLMITSITYANESIDYSLDFVFDPPNGQVLENESLSVYLRIRPKPLNAISYILVKFSENSNRIGFMFEQNFESDLSSDDNVEVYMPPDQQFINKDYQDLLIWKIKRMKHEYSQNITASIFLNSILLKASSGPVMLQKPEDDIQSRIQIGEAKFYRDSMGRIEFSSEEIVQLFCSGKKANPAPRISWFKRDNETGQVEKLNLKAYERTFEFEKFETFTVAEKFRGWSYREDKSKIFCRVHHDAIGEEYFESNQISIRVKYKPLFQWKNSLLESDNTVLISILENSSLTIESNVVSYPASRVKWIRAIDNITMSTYNQLHLQSTGVKDRGIYTCIAQNEVGYSRINYNVVVYYLPRISITPSRELVEGASINETCHVDAYPPPLSINWKLPKINLPLKQGKILTINNLTRYDKGHYICVVHVDMNLPDDIIFDNFHERDLWTKQDYITKTMNVQVLHSPGKAFIDEHATRVAAESSISLSCRVHDKIDLGNPMSNFVWTFKGLTRDSQPRLLSDISSKYSDGLNMDHISLKNELKIAKASIQDSGEYSCRLSNSEGNGTISSIKLSVTSGPIMLQTREPGTVIGGSAFDPKASLSMPTFYIDTLQNLTCLAESNPMAEFTWFKDKIPLNLREEDQDSLLEIKEEISDFNVFHSKSTLAFKEPEYFCRHREFCDWTLIYVKWILSKRCTEYVCIAKNSYGRDKVRFVYQPNFGIVPLTTVQRVSFYDSKSFGRKIGPLLCDFSGTRKIDGFNWYQLINGRWQKIQFDFESNKFEQQVILDRPLYEKLIDFIEKEATFRHENQSEVIEYFNRLKHASTALWISDFKAADSHEYKCEAYRYGNSLLNEPKYIVEAFDIVKLSETNVPRPVNELKQIEATETSILFKWNPGHHGISNVNNHVITLDSDELSTFSVYNAKLTDMILNSQEFEIGVIELSSKQLEKLKIIRGNHYLNLTDLDPDTKYQISITSKNNLGTSKEPIKIIGRTKEAVLEKPQGDVLDKETGIVTISPGSSGLCARIEYFHERVWESVVPEDVEVLSLPKDSQKLTINNKKHFDPIEISYSEAFRHSEEVKIYEKQNCLPLQSSSIQRVKIHKRNDPSYALRIRYCIRNKPDTCSGYVNIPSYMTNTLIFLVGIACITLILIFIIILAVCYMRKANSCGRIMSVNHKLYKNVAQTNAILEKTIISGTNSDNAYQNYPLNGSNGMNSNQTQIDSGTYLVMCPEQSQPTPWSSPNYQSFNLDPNVDVNQNVLGHPGATLTPTKGRLFNDLPVNNGYSTFENPKARSHDTGCIPHQLNAMETSYTLSNWLNPNTVQCSNLPCEPMLGYSMDHSCCHPSSFVDSTSHLVGSSQFQTFPYITNTSSGTMPRRTSNNPDCLDNFNTEFCRI